MSQRPKLPWLNPEVVAFPDPQEAWQAPDGLLAAGGALTIDWLRSAYRAGIFPWFDDDSGPILWWSPNPRAGLDPNAMHVPRRLRRSIRSAHRQKRFRATADRAFAAVVQQCAAPRAAAAGTWITPKMRSAYEALHSAGFAHSIEIWEQEQLVGGIYGVATGGVFCGESMFSRCTGGSKLAFYVLCQHLATSGYRLLDAQMPTTHLATLGVQPMSRDHYLDQLGRYDQAPCLPGPWQLSAELAQIPDLTPGNPGALVA